MLINLVKKTVISTVAILTISACNPSDQDSLVNICKSHPELCEDLHKSTDCRYKRSTLIRARYYDKIAPTKEHTINLLDELSTYESCLELTLLMQFNQERGRKQQRIDNYFTTKKLMEDKLKETKDTQDPHVAYYLWTRFQDLNAKKIFLKAAKKKGNKDPDLLIKLAAIYAKESPQYSLNLFYKALRVSRSLDDIPNNVFTFILTIFYQNNRFEQAYIWAVIAEKVSDKDLLPINFDLILQKGLRNSKKLIHNEDALQETADTYYAQLTKGTFNSPTPQLTHH